MNLLSAFQVCLGVILMCSTPLFPQQFESETHRVMGGGGEGEVCILRSPTIAASPISLLSMGGVCDPFICLCPYILTTITSLLVP